MLAEWENWQIIIIDVYMWKNTRHDLLQLHIILSFNATRQQMDMKNKGQKKMLRNGTMGKTGIKYWFDLV